MTKGMSFMYLFEACILDGMAQLRHVLEALDGT
jgi:hypothetical protein